MKKYALILIASFVLFGCKVGLMNDIDRRVSQCYIGMPFSELQSLMGENLKLVEITDRRSVYQVNVQYNRMNYSGFKRYVRFFYFDTDGKLYQLDKGVTPADVKVEVKNE